MRLAFHVVPCLIWLLLPLGALADPTRGIEISPAPGPPEESFSPGVRLAADLGLVEEEFLVSGQATVYTYNDPPVRDEIIPLDEDVPYTTRIIVRRPPNANQFNGTVVIEWWNSTAGFDTAPVWDPAAEYFAREGIVYVGVTNSTTSLGFLVGGCSLFGILPPTCPTRYVDLSMPENGQAYEISSQLANALKLGGADSPLPVDFDVERVFHAGQSQQGGSMVTYATAFHFPANDGYFIQAASSARRINFGPACGEEDSPPYPDCTPRLQGDDRRVRTDLPVPVYRAMTETDVEGVLASGSRQEDTEFFRYYEMPGTSHTTVHKDIEIIPASLFPPNGLFLEDTCLLPLNTLADGPVLGSYLHNAMWENMQETVRRGTAAPHGDLIETNAANEMARDEFGNALGGIRLPVLDVPTATYTGRNVISPALPPFLQPLLDLFCRLAGSTLPFDDELIHELYPNHGRYVSQVVRATSRLRRQGFLLNEDAKQIRIEAAHSEIGACGLGFELVLALPPLMWLHSRRSGKT
jgi:hypothetical protein